MLPRIGLEVAVPFPELVERVAGELPVPVEARNVVIDGSVVHDIRMLAIDQGLRQPDHLGDVLGRLRRHVGFIDAERGRILEDRPGVLLGDLQGLEPLVLDGEQHLVDRLGRGLVRHVAHIGDVLDEGDPEPLKAQGAPDQIGQHVGAEVPEVRVPVHGGTARIHLDVAGLDRHDLLDRTRQRVVQAHACEDTQAQRAVAGPSPSGRGAIGCLSELPAGTGSDPCPFGSGGSAARGGGGMGIGIELSTPECSRWAFAAAS